MASSSDRRELPQVDLNEYGRSGTSFYSGFITEDPNTALQGTRGLETLRKMSYDPTCAALVRAVVDPIRSTKWFIEPASDDPTHVEQADFVHHVLWEFGSQSFDDVVRQALRGMMEMGFTLMEIVWRWIEDGDFAGKVGWDKLAWRSQLTKFKWNVDEVDMAGGAKIRQLVSVTQKAPPTYEAIDIERDKFLLWVHEMTGENYDGIAALRYAYQPWVYKQGLLKVEAIGLERAYMGIPKATIPQDFSDKELSAGQKIVENLRTHESAGIVHPEQIGIDVLFNKVEGQAMRQAVDFHDVQIVLSYLAAFLKLGAHNVGSFALSEDQSDLFLMAINGNANYFAQVMNQWPGIAQLIDVNYKNTDMSKLPKLAHGDVGQRSLDKLARGLALLAQAGMITPDDATEDKLRDFMELPERDASLQPEAVGGLIEAVMPPDWVPGMKHTARAAVPPPPGSAQSQAAPGVGGQTDGGATTVAGGGIAQEAKSNAMGMSDRKGGRLTSAARTRLTAMEGMRMLLSDAQTTAGYVPERPSIVVAKNRRPYVLRAPAKMTLADPVRIPKKRTSRFSYTPKPEHASAVADHFVRRRAIRQGEAGSMLMEKGPAVGTDDTE